MASLVFTQKSGYSRFSQTLHDSLPNVHAQVSIDKFWSNWSKLLLNMANEIESIAILLSNAAVAFLESDKAIMQAFHADQAAQDIINSELNQIKADKDTFDQTFSQEQAADDAVNTQEASDQKKADEQDKEAADQAFNQSVDWSASDL